jgi:serine beta-lactamase-like protein LACTB, mitochondrial
VSKSRTQTILALIVAAVGLLIAAILGLFTYMSVTATPFFPDAEKVPSSTHLAPPRDWAEAVKQAQQRVRASVAAQNLPGLSVAVAAGGDIVWAEGFGWSDLENHVPVTPETRFRIGTASTVLTSAAVGLLLDKGKLRLSDEIQTYVPDFPKKQWAVTLQQVMAHMAGITRDAGDEEPLSAHCDRPVDALPRFAARPLLFEPGTRYHYSSYDWILVSAAIEAAAAEPFDTFMRKQIFEPLGMDHTGSGSETESTSDRASFYFPRFAADPRYGPQEPRDVDLSCFAGASAFLSTPTDLVRFGMAMNDGTLVQPATVQLLQTPQRLPSGEETGYGLGWDLETAVLGDEQARLAGHDGEIMGGMLASFMTARDRGLVVAVTSNTSYAKTFAIGVSIAQAFAEQGKRPARK